MEKAMSISRFHLDVYVFCWYTWTTGTVGNCALRECCMAEMKLDLRVQGWTYNW